MKADWNTQVLQFLWQEGDGCRDRWAEQRDETGGRRGGTEQALRPWKMRKALKEALTRSTAMTRLLQFASDPE